LVFLGQAVCHEEDIPANFPEEDNNLQEDEPVRKCRLLFYTLEQ
jgi:hypothetical protein